MDEIRINNKVSIETRQGIKLEGEVCAIEYDRVSIVIDEADIEKAQTFKELDDLKITAHTHFGAKTMISSVISTINKNNVIVVENNNSISIEQKRKYVRVVCNFEIEISKDEIYNTVKTKNISAGGIAFERNDLDFNIGDEIKIKFFKEIFDKDFKCSAKIIKINDDSFVAEFNNINEYNESKIMRYVFKNVSKSSTGC